MVWAKRADGSWGNLESAPAVGPAAPAEPAEPAEPVQAARAVSQLAAAFTAPIALAPAPAPASALSRRTAPAPPPVPVPVPATRRRAAPPPPNKERPVSRPPLPARPPLPRAVTSPSPPPLPEPEPEPEYDDYEHEASGSTTSLPHPPLSSHRPPPTRAKTTSGPSSSKTGPSWSDNKSGYAKGKAIELARNRRNCLNPPPECFSRPVPPQSAPGDDGIQITYAPIVPVVIRSPNSNDLARAITTGAAFKSKPPAMATHDVYRQDWDQLWEDIDETARIELRTSAGISVATLPLMPIFGAGFVVGTLVERKLRAERVKPTCKLIEVYNVQFFRPRRLDVYLAQDNIRLSGPYTYSTSRKEVDPAQIAVKEATTEQDKAKAMSEVSKWAGKFRIVVQSWPPA